MVNRLGPRRVPTARACGEYDYVGVDPLDGAGQVGCARVLDALDDGRGAEASYVAALGWVADYGVHCVGGRDEFLGQVSGYFS